MTSPSFQLPELLTWLDSRINYERTGPGDRLGPQSDATHDPGKRLEGMRKLLDLLDNPQKLFPSIHLTGTNGKTSTARMLTDLMLAQGLTAGTYTSPHLQTLNERIMLNSEPIIDDDLAEVLFALQLIEPMLGGEIPSYFEVMTAAAFRAFADAAMEVGIIEVGVGGEWDATNVIDAPVAVVTNVSLDHQGYLGSTRAEIATQKSGIVKPGATLILGETDPELFPIFEAREAERIVLLDRDFGVENNRVAVGGRVVNLRTPGAYYEDVFVSLHGVHQGTNAAVALAAAEAFFHKPLADDVVRETFGAVRSPGRMEVMHRQPLVVIDGAHNVAGAQALANAVTDEFGDVHRVFVIGMLAPHDPIEILTALQAEKARLVIATQVDWPRAIPAEVIAEAAAKLGVPTCVVPVVADAVHEAMAAAADEEIVVVAGSLYVAGEARTALSS